MTLKRLYSYAGSLPSTERCKWQPLRSPENLQWTFKNTPIKTFSALLRKFQGNPQSFCSRSVEPLKFRKNAQTKRINSTPFSRKMGKNRFFRPILSSYKISHLRNFDMTPLPVRTVDGGESSNEIAIHNFEKKGNSRSPLWKADCHVTRSTKTELDIYCSTARPCQHNTRISHSTSHSSY